MKLRPYQRKAIDAIVNAFQRREPTDRNAYPWILAGMPTGSGKTLVGLLAAAKVSNGGGVIWLAQQKELLVRAEEELEEAIGAGLIEKDHAFQFITMQSFKNLRCDREDALIVFDEAHHLHSSNEWIKDLRRRRLPTLGLTATPRWSHDKDGWRLAHHVTRDELTPEWLAFPVPRIQKTGFSPRHVGLKSIGKTSAKDFDSDTYRALNNTRRNQIVADFLWQHREQLSPMIVFVGRIEHAESLARALDKKGLRAAFVHGQISSEERTNVFRDFKKGALEALINVFLVSEGVDIPDAKSIVMAVPTISDIRFAQMLGRGCRKTKKKQYFNLVDFVDNLGKFQKLLADKYLFNGSIKSDRSGDDNPSPEYLREYRCAEDRPGQPYLKRLRQSLIQGFALDAEASAISPELAKEHLTHFCKRKRLPFCLDGVTPLEVPLVRTHVYPLLQDRYYPATRVRKEYRLEEGRQRCDILILGENMQVIEFATTCVNDTKVEQLLGYLKTLRAQRVSKTVEGTLVATSLNGNSTSRMIECGKRSISFYNWHDFLKQHVRETSSTST